MTRKSFHQKLILFIAKITKIIDYYRYKKLEVRYIGFHKQLVLKNSKIIHRLIEKLVVLTCNL